MCRKLFITIGIFFMAVFSGFAAVVSGTVTDKNRGEVLPMATVTLTDASGKYVASTVSGADGRFSFSGIAVGEYVVKVTYLGYKESTRSVRLKGEKATVSVALVEDTHVLSELEVKGRATRATQKGDSLVYNAEAFKVLQGSTAEDLLSKMPGIVVEGGTIQAQGEDVKKILVDGKEFFEGDVNLAIKNLPSDIIASIEVFDKKSDQAEFTGFDDGEEIKTINIVTKNGFSSGTFGNLYGGYGMDNRYKVGGNVNYFDGDRRISVLGMSNNVNNQNFSQEDLAGVMSASSSGRRGGKRGGGGGNGGGGRGGSSASDFMVGQLGGVASTNGAGLNYVDQWGKMKFTGSYFFNQTKNDSEQQVEREFFDSSLPGMTYEEFTQAQMENFNHRFNIKMDYQFDKNNSLTIRPKLSLQDNHSWNTLDGTNLLNGVASDQVTSNSIKDAFAYNAGLDLTYRHRFGKEGRTLSAMFGGTWSNNSSDTYTDYLNRLYDTQQEDGYSQYKKTAVKQQSYRGNLMFTEKLWDKFQLQTNYKFSYADNSSDTKTYNKSTVTDLYDQLDESMSNVYQSDYLTQSGGIGIRYRKGAFNAMLGSDFQWANLMGDQVYPQPESLDHRYFSVLPSFNARYSLNRSNSFMFRYRSSSSAPSVSDLQSVIDNTNPLYLSTGNPELDQQINHSLNLRYILTTKWSHTLIVMAGATFRSNYIADSTFVAKEDIVLSPSVTLNKGAQFTKPVNLDGYYSFQSMLTYGFTLDFLRSNINLSLAANYANAPTIFDGTQSYTRELNLIPKVIVGSNISENLDFTLSYSATVNKMMSTLDQTNASDYICHSASAKLGWTFWKGFTFRSTFSYIGYDGLEMADSDYFLWNASLGKKFLKNNAAELKIEAFDLLKQNRAFSHRVGSNYYEYVNGNVLEPYFMLTFTYDLRL